MGYRIDPEGYESLVNAVGAGSTSSGASVVDDGIRSPYTDEPFSSGRNEFLANEGLHMALVPADEIREIRPIVPQVLFPDEGIAYDRQALTISETLDTDRWAPTMRAFVSGPSKPRTRGEEQDDAWSGTMRNTSTSVNPMM